jgi:hypothetical protein
MTRRVEPSPPLPGLGVEHKRRVGSVERGVNDQLRAQRALGSLDDVDAGLISVARKLARALDAEDADPDGSRYTVGALAGRLVPVLVELRGGPRDVGADVDAELAALIAAVRDAPRPDP